jgi:hypothetical protein
MSIGPVTGNRIAVNLPIGKIVFWSALVQSSANQFIQVQDSTGAVVFTTEGSSSSGGTPTQIGQGFFQAADTNDVYYIFIGTNGGQSWSNVLWTQDVLVNGAAILFGKYMFTSEDGSDNDYNDSYLQIQWFNFTG